MKFKYFIRILKYNLGWNTKFENFMVNKITFFERFNKNKTG